MEPRTISKDALQKALRAFEVRTGSYLPRAHFKPPPRADRPLDRAHLLARLEESFEAAAVLVQGSAGYGKTVLLGQWFSILRKRKLRCAWLTIDEYARSPSIFLGRLVASLHASGCEPDAPVRDWLCGRRKWTDESVAQRIADRGDSEPAHIVVFLDDVQHLTGSQSLSCVKTLVDAASSRFHLVMASRGEPGLARSRLLSTGRLREIGERELAFTPREISAFHVSCRGSPLTDTQSAAIAERTAGWACGIAMLFAGPDAPDLMRQRGPLRGSAAHQINNFFSEESFGSQEEELQRFLLKVSLLKRFCGPLCEAVCGCADGTSLLRRCERNGLFLLQEAEPGWFRFQDLFGDFLRSRAQALPATERATCHRRASGWLAANGQPLEACEHALLAGEVTYAAQLLAESCETLFRSWRLPRVPELAARLPETVCAQFPLLMLAAACQLVVEWRFDEAEALLASVRARLDEIEVARSMDARELHFLRGLQLHREAMLAQFRDQPHVAEQRCERLLVDHQDAPSYLKARFYSILMNARRVKFKVAELDRLDALSRQHNSQANTPLVGLIHDCIAGLALHMTGRTESALLRLREAVDTATVLEGRGRPYGALAALPLAEIYYARNEIEAARALVGEFLPVANGWGLGEKLLCGWLCHARLVRYASGEQAALGVLDEADTVARQLGFRRMRLVIGAQRIQYLVRVGGKHDAEAVGQELGIPKEPAAAAPSQRTTLTEEAQALAWMRLCLAQGKLTEASRIARLWRSHLAACGAPTNQLQWEILLIQALLMDGQDRAATRVLRSAFCTGRHGRLIRVFLDEGPAVTSLIAQYTERESGVWEAPDDFAAQVASFIPQPHSAVATATAAASKLRLAGGLSQTEIEVLTMAGAGLRNCEVGKRLGMSEGSIKWCLQQIYDKIGVRKRSQAVERARRLGLIGA